MKVTMTEGYLRDEGYTAIKTVVKEKNKIVIWGSKAIGYDLIIRLSATQMKYADVCFINACVLRHVALRSEVEAFATQRKVTSKIEFLEAIQAIEKELKENSGGK